MKSGKNAAGARDVTAAIESAIRLHRQGKLPAARKHYERILKQAPDNPDALHFYGLLNFHLQQPEIAEKYIRRALEIAPDYADARNNLGIVLKALGRPLEAEAIYRAQIDARPDSPDTYNNMGLALKAQGRHDEAISAFRVALGLKPDAFDILCNLGNTLLQQHRLDEAEPVLRKAYRINPAHAGSIFSLGRLMQLQGRVEEALPFYRQWLKIHPDDPVAQHLIAACQGITADRASNEYIQQTFNDFADTFDANLKRLDYQAPARVAEMVQEFSGPPASALAVLDAGCGTGLCGPLLRPHARLLTGVDLSSAMLAKARERAVYDELVEAELTTFLGRDRKRWDLITLADTLCYFGALQPVCKAAAEALRTEGWLIFTVERASPDDIPEGYRIAPSGRYKHTFAHVQESLDSARLLERAIRAVDLRQEAGATVHGWLVVAQSPLAAGR